MVDGNDLPAIAGLGPVLPGVVEYRAVQIGERNWLTRIQRSDFQSEASTSIP